MASGIGNGSRHDLSAGTVAARHPIGFDRYTIAHRGLSPIDTLEFAHRHNFDGVQFLEPAALDLHLDRNKLSEVKERAERDRLYIEVGLPSPNPVRRGRELCRVVGPSEMAVELEPHVHALAHLGCRHGRIYFGDRHERFRSDVSWPHQIDATVAVIDRLKPLLRSLGIRLAIETHADLTVDELISVLERIDHEIAGVTLDTGNLVMRLDEPIEAARRLAPWVICTHVKDAALEFSPRGLRWQARPLGLGILPLPEMLAILVAANPDLALSIELHPRTYDLPIFDREWLGFFPRLTAGKLSSVIQLAAQCENRYDEGSLPRPDSIEAVPWPDRDLDWLASSLGYLRSVVPALLATCP